MFASAPQARRRSPRSPSSLLRSRLPAGRAAFAAGFAAVFVAVVAAACGGAGADDGSSVVTVGPGDAVRIGLSVSPIPPNELLPGGDGAAERIAMAAELAGRDVTVAGRPVEFVRDESACAAEGAPEGAQRLIDAGVVAVIGPLCSPAVIAAQPVYEQAGVPHVAPASPAIAATHPPGRDPYRTFFRVTYSDAVQGEALARFAGGELGARRVYVVHDVNAYGQTLRAEFARAFTGEALAGEVVGTASFAAGTTDFTAAVAGIEEMAPDLVVFAGFFDEAARFVAQLRGAGLDTPLLAPDGVRDARFLDAAGAAAEGAYVSLPTPVLAGPAYDRFRAEFVAAYGVSPEGVPFAAEAYDAARVIVEALRQVATEDGDALRIDRRALRNAIAATEMDGAVGGIRFDERGDNVAAEAPVAFFQVQDGAFRQITALQGRLGEGDRAALDPTMLDTRAQGAAVRPGSTSAP